MKHGVPDESVGESARFFLKGENKSLMPSDGHPFLKEVDYLVLVILSLNIV